MRVRTAISGLLLPFALLHTDTGAAGSYPRVSEVEISTGDNAAQPSLSSDGNGGFLLTWQEKAADAASLHFMRLGADGRVLDKGSIAQSSGGAAWFVNWADFPSLCVLDNGDWVTFWLQKSGAGVYAYDILLTRSIDEGASWSSPIRLNRDNTRTEHGFVSLVPVGEDRVLAIWLDGRYTAAPPVDQDDDGHQAHAGGMTLRSAVVNRAGEILDEHEIDGLVCDCCNTDLVQVGEQFMAIYRDRSDAEIRDNSFSLLMPGGSWSTPQTVYSDNWKIAACPVNGPALAVRGERVLAAWTTMEADQLSVRLAPGDSEGFEGMVPVETGPDVQGRVDMVTFGEKDFLLSWLGRSDSDSAASAIRVAVVNLDGGLGAQKAIAELPPGRSTGFPRMASSGDIALIAWTEPSPEGSSIRVMRLSQEGD